MTLVGNRDKLISIVTLNNKILDYRCGGDLLLFCNKLFYVSLN